MAFVSRASVLAACVLSAAIAVCAGDREHRQGVALALTGGGAGIENACVSCHGAARDVPRLAGLPEAYLERQLIAFAEGERRSEPMGAIAAALTPDERASLARHYARRPPPASQVTDDAGDGRLHRSGDRVRGLPACASCHGIEAEGLGDAPPLWGQPADYLEVQLDRFASGVRAHEPAEGLPHARIAWRLSPGERAAVSVYLASLPAPSMRPAAIAARDGTPLPR